MRKPSSRPSAERPRRSGAPSDHGNLTLLADLFVIGLAAAQLAALSLQALRTQFYTDECFHAYMSEWIARNASLPREVAAFYSGFYYYYPPLFHVLGAISVALIGVGALKFLNIAVMAALLTVLFLGPPDSVARAPRRWAVLLLLANGFFVAYSVRFYAEMLTALLTLAAIVLLLRLRAAPRMGTALWLGVVTGLALVAKHTSLVLLASLGIIVARDVLRHEHVKAKTGLVAIATALVIGLPFFARNWALYGSPFYPAMAPNVHKELYALHLETFGLPALRFYREVLGATGPLILIVCVAGLAGVVVRRGWDIVSALLLACVVLLSVAPLMPVHEPRHMLPVIGVMALTGSLVLFEGLRRWRWAILGVDAALLLTSALFLARLPDYRTSFNLPPALAEAYQAVRERTPEGATILSLWTYDTAYYSKRPATWPIPWGQKEHPFEMFEEHDPARLLGELEHFHIDYLLVPLYEPAERFNGSNYPRRFLENLKALVAAGKFTVIWQSRHLALLRTS